MNIKEYWHLEVIGGRHKKFSWYRLFKAYFKSNKEQFLFEYRLAQYIYLKKGNNLLVKYLKRRIKKRYPVDIPVECVIGKGFYIAHLIGIVITDKAQIGSGFTIFQNVTIGQKNSEAKILIGDNVTIGANSCIVGLDMFIGDDVEVGAFSFLNKSLPSRVLYYTKKESVIHHKNLGIEYIESRNTRNRNR